MIYEPASWTSHVGACLPGVTALEDYARGVLGIDDLGCFVDRAVRGSTSIPSLHREGRAVDLATTDALDAFVLALVEHYADLGIQMVIWQRRYWRCDRGSGWHPYTGEDPHTGHAHVELTWHGGQTLTVAAITAALSPPSEEELMIYVSLDGKVYRVSGNTATHLSPATWAFDQAFANFVGKPISLVTDVSSARAILDGRLETRSGQSIGFP